jgi:hypothetical protein
MSREPLFSKWTAEDDAKLRRLWGKSRSVTIVAGADAKSKKHNPP